MPGARKIGAAISGPRITGGNFMDITLYSVLRRVLRTFWEGFWGRGSQKGSEKGA